MSSRSRDEILLAARDFGWEVTSDLPDLKVDHSSGRITQFFPYMVLRREGATVVVQFHLTGRVRYANITINYNENLRSTRIKGGAQSIVIALKENGP